MGFNCVAVLLNDHCHALERDGPLGKRISRAMQDWRRTDPHSIDAWFGAGSVISCSHADHYQIVIVHGNTGETIYDATDLPYYALDDMAECLRRHGWRASPPPRKRKKTTEPE